MTRLDAFILMGTVLIFLSIIEVITTTIWRQIIARGWRKQLTVVAD
jgi:hypothetical protein